MNISTKRTYSYFLNYVGKKSGMLSIIFFMITMGVLSDMYIPILYKNFFDAISTANSITSIEVFNTVKSLVLQIAVTYFSVWLFWRGSGFLIAEFEARIMNSLYNACFSYLHKHSYKFFANSFAGSLVRRVTKFVKSFETISDKYFYEVYPLILRIILSVIVVFTTSKMLGIALLVWTVIFLALNYFAILYKLPYDLARSASDSKLSSILSDTITNNINIKLFANHEFESEYFKEATIDNMIKTKKEWHISMVIEAIQSALVFILEIIILWVAFKLWTRGLITVGDFVMIQTYFFQLADRLWNFGRIIRQIYSSLADAHDMVEILHTPHEIQDKPNAKILKVKKGEIEFKDINFAYSKNHKIFENFSLKIKGGEKVAVVGDSGGGKSSLIKLLFRFYDIESGEILIDGQNIKDIKQESLRDQISLVPQDPILFHRTLMENIRYGKSNASDKRVFEAAKGAHAEEFISRLSHKYDTYVGERGVKLSGGERQRVAIARAILKDAPILVLDEATSSLDSMSEKYIQDAMKTLFQDKTVIVIAHRLSTIMEMDRIIVIRRGKIIEEGTHRTLLAKKGYYRELWQTQAGGFIE